LFCFYCLHRLFSSWTTILTPRLASQMNTDWDPQPNQVVIVFYTGGGGGLWIFLCKTNRFVVCLGARAACGTTAGCNDITLESISYKFGIVMTLSGLLGVPVGSLLAQNIRHKECASRHFFYLLYSL
jgi:hypothetical protein